MKIIKLDIVDVKCNKFYDVKFFDNGPGFRDMRGIRKMGFLGRLQEFFCKYFKNYPTDFDKTGLIRKVTKNPFKPC